MIARRVSVTIENMDILDEIFLDSIPFYEWDDLFDAKNKIIS
jgi:hypothetical protein